MRCPPTIEILQPSKSRLHPCCRGTKHSQSSALCAQMHGRARITILLQHKCWGGGCFFFLEIAVSWCRAAWWLQCCNTPHAQHNYVSLSHLIVLYLSSGHEARELLVYYVFASLRARCSIQAFRRLLRADSGQRPAALEVPTFYGKAHNKYVRSPGIPATHLNSKKPKCNCFKHRERARIRDDFEPTRSDAFAKHLLPVTNLLGSPASPPLHNSNVHCNTVTITSPALMSSTLREYTIIPVFRVNIPRHMSDASLAAATARVFAFIQRPKTPLIVERCKQSTGDELRTSRRSSQRYAVYNIQ